MQWLLTSQVRHYHKRFGGSGHVWQGRFKSFSVQRNEHLIAALRDVLQDPGSRWVVEHGAGMVLVESAAAGAD